MSGKKFVNELMNWKDQKVDYFGQRIESNIMPPF